MSGTIRLAAVLSCVLATGIVQAGPPTFSLDVQIEGAGAVTLDPPGGIYKRNNMVTLTALPDDGHVFDHWTGDVAGDSNPTRIRISSNHSVTAVFLPDGGGGGSGGGGVKPPLPDTGMVISYFTSWSVYRRAYYPGDIVSSGAADRLDVINYAFAGIGDDLRCQILDEFADYEKRFDANETVDGVADNQAQPLKGNFNQLRKLKTLYPGIRVMISIGGWTESNRFSAAAMPANRDAFVESCVDMFIRGNVAEGVDAPGVFDGIDIDWEYPGRCGASCDFSPDDPQNFTDLLRTIRARLKAEEDAVEASTGTRPDYLLTIAAPAGEYYYSVLQLDQLAGPLDWINVMAYDVHGPWEGSGPANHHAPLYRSPCDSLETADYGDKAIQAYLSAGIPPGKLLLGVPFYGHGWRGVAAVNDGECQAARGIPKGKYEKGTDDYEVLAGSGDPVFSDPAIGVNWSFDGSEFWSYDDAQSIGWKGGYATQLGLRGMMSWELSGDDDSGTLIRAMSEGLGESRP